MSSCCTKEDTNTNVAGRKLLINLLSHKPESAPAVTDQGGKGDRLNLKRHVREKLVQEIFEKGINEKLAARTQDTKGRSFGLFALIVDDMGSEILNACMKMTELGQRRIAVVEKLELRRKPMLNLEAIYVIKPDENSVLLLIEDFRDRESALYKAAHIFFTRKLSPTYLDAIAQSPISGFIKTMKELYVAFIPVEAQVFNLGMKENMFDMYSPITHPAVTLDAIDIMSEKILSLCQILGLYPQIRYQSSNKAFSTAQALRRKLDAYNVSVDGKLSSACPAKENVLLVLERNVDTTTALLHAMTMEALVHDVLPVKKGFYEFKCKNAQDELITKQAKLDETSDELWYEIRHLHIADAATTLPEKFKDFLQKNHIIHANDPVLTDMTQILKAFPQYHKEISQFALHMDLSKRCMDLLKESCLAIVHAEQNVATGININTKKPITSIIPELAPFLSDDDIDVMNKVRLIMLYVMLKNGSPESDIEKIFDISDVPMRYKSYVINMSFLGLNILTRGRVSHNRPPVRQRPLDGRYESARWTPYVVDLIEDILAGSMRRDSFPVMESAKHPEHMQEAPQLKENGSRGNSDFDPLSQHYHVKRIIVVFIGGLTFAEMQSAHKIAEERGVDIIIGGDDIITPSDFMERVRDLRRWTALEDYNSQEEKIENTAVTFDDVNIEEFRTQQWIPHKI